MKRQTIYQLLAAAVLTASAGCSGVELKDLDYAGPAGGGAGVSGLQPGEALLLIDAGLAAGTDGGSLTEAGEVTRAGTNADGTPVAIQGDCLDKDELLYCYFPWGVRVGNKTWGTASTFRVGDYKSGTTPPRKCAVTDASRQPYFIETATSATIAAFYPCFDKDGDMVEDSDDGDKIVTENTASFSVEQDQSSTDGYKRSDLMFCRATANRVKTDTEVTTSLELKHMLSKLTVTVTSSGDNYRPLVQQIRIVGGSRTVALSHTKSGTGSSADAITTPWTYGIDENNPGLELGDKSDALTHADPIVMYRAVNTTAQEVTASAILPPQTIATGTHFIEVVTDLGTATYRLTAQAVLESGKNHVLTVDITPAYINKTVDLEPWDVKAWTAGATGSQDYNDVPLGVEFQVTDGNTADKLATRFFMRFVEVGKAASNEDKSGVTVSDEYYIGETEVTQAVWKAAEQTMPTLDEPNTGDQKPITNINVGDANTFIAWLNDNLSSQIPAGFEFALPTLDQWRYAFLGGSKSMGTKYAGSDDLNEVGWHYHVVGSFASNSLRHNHEVAQLAPNELGLYDMSGNVCEMVYKSDSQSYWMGGSVEHSTSTYPTSFQVNHEDPAADNTTAKTSWGIRLVLRKKQP